MLIAMTPSDHEHHDRVLAWVAGVDGIALCPIGEGALVRFLVQVGQSPTAAKELFDALHASPRREFWPDSLSYRGVDLAHVSGHRQVPDAGLASMAAAKRALLATPDEGLAQVAARHVVLIPAVGTGP